MSWPKPYVLRLVNSRVTMETERFLRSAGIRSSSTEADRFRGLATEVVLGFEVQPDGSGQLVSYNGRAVTLGERTDGEPTVDREVSVAGELLAQTVPDDPLALIAAEGAAQQQGERAALLHFRDKKPVPTNPYRGRTEGSPELRETCARSWDYGFDRLAGRLNRGIS